VNQYHLIVTALSSSLMGQVVNVVNLRPIVNRPRPSLRNRGYNGLKPPKACVNEPGAA